MLTREEIKARLLEHRPNICNDLRADESEEFKNAIGKRNDNKTEQLGKDDNLREAKNSNE